MPAPTEIPAVADTAALQAELDSIRTKLKDFEGTVNERNALKALIDRAKADPDEALALADHDFDSYSKAIIDNKIRPRTKAEREAAQTKQAEVSEIEKLRKRNKELEDAEETKRNSEQWTREVAFLDEHLPEDEFPLLRSLSMSPTVLREWYAAREADPEKKEPDFKAVAKKVQDGVAESSQKLLRNPKALSVLFSDPEIVTLIKTHLGVSTSEVKKLSAALVGAGELGKKEARKADPAPSRGDSQAEKDARSIAALLNKKDG